MPWVRRPDRSQAEQPPVGVRLRESLESRARVGGHGGARARRLGDRVEVWCQDVLELDLDEPVDAIISTATLHWVTDHDRLWARLAQALRPGGVLEIQCGGEGNIARVRTVIEAVARDTAPELVGRSPWVFAGPQETERRLREMGFTATRCWLEERPTCPSDVAAFVPTSILTAHLARLPEERRERFAAAVVAGVRLPLDYVRLNASAVRGLTKVALSAAG
jgi:trans-aconitate 2-methyltransferase